MSSKTQKLLKKPRRKETVEKSRFLAELEASLIKNVKLEAIERSTGASGLVEEAVQEWLKRKRNGSGYRKGSRPPEDRRQFLAWPEGKLLMNLILAALSANVTATSLLEQAVAKWVDQNLTDRKA